MLIGVLVFGTIAVLLIGSIVGFGNSVLQLSRRVAEREMAFQIAEAGVDYYRWHLAHDSDDYQDGTGQAGPYTHQFFDKSGDHIGDFVLTITPPISGSTIVTVLSEGRLATTTAGIVVSRKIKTRLAIPSFAKYAVVVNDAVRFGEGTEVFGPIHSNSGIRFDGLAHNLVTSAVTSYDDPDHTGAVEFGVHTHLRPPPLTGSYTGFVSAEAPPSTVSTRSDVFQAGRLFPVPAVDFTGITTDLASIKADAQASGRYFAPSGSFGYHVVFFTDDTFNLYRVTGLSNIPNQCTNTSNQEGWGTWSIRSGGETLLGNYAIPANGLIFIEDNVWVNGTINTARVTLASGRFPDNSTTRTSITVNSDLRYTNYDGRDVIALIAQKNMNVGLYSSNILRIDAALIAQNGRAGRYYYESDCGSERIRNTITLYGMIASSQRYGFAYTDNTGYINRDIIYDSFLLYGPPPSFPLTSDQYQTISWEEIQ
ncbi:MAG: hypothetical protein A2664_01475 [Candidatus Taylorbacteria bacterium RIFCSPHIGHO2_01_FULL_46_22b]|uniref:Type 4 fimbrial biogenesis protein PilX N-terminal domain-containing protein n=1 Tax=Candidatus Taylorbacteria bacterium RIFCSPHIGHO2_01_FULL_46_22b TaxID=1802301 RepID=A0A1G2M4Z0_9BACT|nr:MAG: hypothetical protein A2664_01475 [Candidatus Taylorbacteria bacterium RIFCSPHIGHO2_01_FULL_46_22b]